MDQSKDVLALFESLQNQIQEKDAQQQQMQQQIQDLKQEKDTQQQQILDEKKQRQQQIWEEKQQRQQLADELHEFKASPSQKPLAEHSSLMKNVFIFLTFLFVCEFVFLIAYFVGSFLGFYNSLALLLLDYFFGNGLQPFALAWFICFAPSPEWLLSVFMYLSLVFVLKSISDFVTDYAFDAIVNIFFFIILSLLAWQHQSVWRTLSTKPLEQATPKLFLSLLRTFVYLSIPIVAISIRDQELNEYAGDAMDTFSYTSLGFVVFVRLKIRNNETLLQLLFRLNYKEQVFFCLMPIGYAMFLIHYLFYLSNSVESSAVPLCLITIGLLVIILGSLFLVGTVSKWRYLSWFDTDSPVAASESTVEFSHHLDHITIDF